MGCALVLAGVCGYGIVRFRSLHRVDSHRKLVDDCSSGADRNVIGGVRFVDATAGSTLVAHPIKTPTPGGGAMACAMTVRVAPGGTAQWTTGLNDLDISAATHLSLWLRSTPPIRTIELELVDSRKQSAAVSLHDLLANRSGWQRLRLPIERFPGVNMNQLARLTIRLQAQATPLRGTLLLDDVAFEGPADVFFRSIRDNLYAFPERVRIDARSLSRLPSEAMWRTIAADTWGYFRDLVDTRHHLPMNAISLAPTRQVGDYASPTDIALYLLSVLSAYDLDLVRRDEALQRIRSTLTQLDSLAKWHQLFYNYYNTTNLQVTSQYISSVDNGWLAAALIVLRQAFPELAPLCTASLDRMDFRLFYDEQQGQMRLGYDVQQEKFAPYHYGLIATEARMLSLVAIGKGDVPEAHWFRIYRTLPKEWTWQRQIPRGTYRQYRGHDVFQGYYTSHDLPFVPSWGGSLFEFLMPTLLVKERELAPQGLGLNDQRAVELHIRLTLENHHYPVWGLSPSSTPHPPGGYKEFGVADLGAKGYEAQGIITPYASVLALEFAPEAVSENIRQLLSRYPMYGEYGFYDAVDVARRDVAYRYLALDQGMILLAINNYLNGGVLRNRFHADPVGKRIEWLLQSEQFF